MGDGNIGTHVHGSVPAADVFLGRTHRRDVGRTVGGLVYMEQPLRAATDGIAALCSGGSITGGACMRVFP